MEFKPSVHGFPFPNWWPPGTPVIEVPTPFGCIRIGDAHGGVCGGMVFAAADYFHHGMPVPQCQEKQVFKYFCQRLLESWHLPFGVLKYYDWQRRPTHNKVLAGVTLIDGTAELTRNVEWPNIRRVLDTGGLAPLGLVKADGFHPREMGHHHQVLAYGYRFENAEVKINVYDPNYPGDDTTTLTISSDAITHSCEGSNIRGVFLTEYVPNYPETI
jgi:hypothetical protein